MFEVNVRAFFEKPDTGLFPDYHMHMKLLREQRKAQIQVALNDQDCTQIYQYYTLSPFCYLEVKFLRRIGVGSSVLYLKSSIGDFLEQCHLPVFLKRMWFRYLQRFFNAVDYIVVTRKELIEQVQKEGVQAPRFYSIPEGNEETEADSWVNLYQVMLQKEAAE